MARDDSGAVDRDGVPKAYLRTGHLLLKNHHRYTSHWGNNKARIVVSFEHLGAWRKILAFMATEVNNIDGMRFSYL